MGELVSVPPAVRDRLVVRFGPEVVGWLDALPSLVGELTARWNLEPVAAGGGGTSRVFRCVRRDTGASVWLKLTPEPAIAREEAAALRAWAGRPSVVPLLAEELAVGALLLGDVRPGVQVKRLGWRLADIGPLLRDLRVPAVAPVPHSALRPLTHRVDFVFDLTLRRLAAAGVGEPFDAGVLDRARAAALELAVDGPLGLVHGDLNPANVLSGPGADTVAGPGQAPTPATALVAIDPRPAWGDPDFDAVDWVLDAVTDHADLERRIDTLAALVPGMSPARVLRWCRSLGVLDAALRFCAGRHGPETRFLLTLSRG
ncbi:aminoglycoside phosphotransferase family protein [Streptomyces sp. NPDC088194]|uniref:aminoglycoside phosphotransferase family protein n=1 Tax=Streptomyces sp. NPDC088194 TaxID=3154931 RepID=UPI00344BC205